jgi:hypothetical protein
LIDTPTPLNRAEASKSKMKTGRENVSEMLIEKPGMKLPDIKSNRTSALGNY